MRRLINRKTLVRKGQAKAENKGKPTFQIPRKTSFYKQIANKRGFGDACVIRRVGGIGDILMILPALRQLKEDFPNVRLTFAIDMHTTSGNIYYEIVKNLPFIDEIVDARYVQTKKYIAIIDISSVCIRYEHSGLPALNRIDIFARSMGLPKLNNKLPPFIVEEPEKEWALKQIQKYKQEGKRIVILHTASMEGKRCWPAEKYTEILSRSLKENLLVHYIILDFNHVSNSWKNFSNCSEYSSTSLREMAALISVADCFIGPDSGPMHLAGAVKTRAVVVFGSIPPQARINHYPTHTSVRMDELNCIGCWYKPCPYSVKCMRDLDSHLVYDKMRKILSL